AGHVAVDSNNIPPMVRKAFFRALKEKGHRAAAGELALKPLAEHVQEWRQSLLDKGATETYAELSVNRVLTILKGIDATYWSELDVNEVVPFLAGRRAQGLSVESSNHYTRRIKQFAKWIAKKIGTSTPLADLEILNAKVDRRHDRRALSADELRS